MNRYRFSIIRIFPSWWSSFFFLYFWPFSFAFFEEKKSFLLKNNNLQSTGPHLQENRELKHSSQVWELAIVLLSEQAFEKDFIVIGWFLNLPWRKRISWDKSVFWKISQNRVQYCLKLIFFPVVVPLMFYSFWMVFKCYFHIIAFLP